MRAYLIPLALASVMALASCGGEAAPAGGSGAAVEATPRMPAPTLAELPAPYNTANPEAGGKTYRTKCTSCHFIDGGKGNMVGPNLNGVFERGPAQLAGYGYSNALKALKQPAWTPEMIEEWLARPQAFVPGSSMFFNGIENEGERRDLIAFLLIESRK